jgi:hypothetical protein
MATNKAEKPEKKRLEIKTRTPQKSSGIFDNIGQNRGSGEHPLRELLNAGFPSPIEPTAGAETSDRRPRLESVDAHTAFSSTPTVDAHSEAVRTPDDAAARRPLSEFIDVQSSNLPTPTGRDSGQPQRDSLDAHTVQLRTPELSQSGRLTPQDVDATGTENPASTAVETERPPARQVDRLAPGDVDGAPTASSDVGAQQSTISKTGAHTSRDWNKVEDQRGTGRAALRPNKEILRKFKVYCASNNFTLTEFFELAGMRFLELDAQIDGEVGAMAPLDDRRLKMRYKTRVSIINLYLAYTARFNEHSGNAAGKWSGKWLPRDDEAAYVFNDVDIKAIEEGIIQTQHNKGIGNGKIQTFKYYVDEIQNVLQANMPESALAVMVDYHRATLNRKFGKEVDLSFLEASE